MLTIDGVGEWATTSVGDRRRQRPRHSQGNPFPAFARPALFGVHLLHRLQGQLRRIQADGPRALRRAATTPSSFCDNLIDLKPDGSFRLNLDYFDYCTGLTMTNERFRRAVRRAAARAEDSLTPKRHGPRRLDPGGARGGRAAADAQRSRTKPAWRISASPAAWRSTASPTARSCATAISSNIWIQPAAGDAGGALGAALAAYHISRRPAAHSRQRPRRHVGRLSRPGVQPGRDRTRGLTTAGRALQELDAERMMRDDGAGARRRQGGRLVSGTHGVRPARARRPLDPRRSALADHADEAQPEGQIPRELPAVRAGGAARGRLPNGSSSTSTAPTCCWSPTSRRTAAAP